MRNKSRQKRSKNNVQVSVRLDEETIRYITDESNKTAISISAQINILVKEAIRNRQQNG